MSLAPRWVTWAAAGLLGSGAAMTSSVVSQAALPLRAPLTAAVPGAVDALPGRDLELSELEVRVAGVSDYLMRVYERPEGSTAGVPWVSVYVGYYESQTRGRTIHSPKNCMPGAGWEALESRPAVIPLADGSEVKVNRYRLVNEEEEVLVLYWYQGRGRVVASEFQAKWDLLRDASVERRSDEALVRIVVPVIESEEASFEVARRIAAQLVPSVTAALPAA